MGKRYIAVTDEQNEEWHKLPDALTRGSYVRDILLSRLIESLEMPL